MFQNGYDNENQLITASHPETDALHALESFTYDSLGNRTTDNQGGFSYDDKKYRLEEDYKYLYGYDLNGNLITKQEKGLSGKVWNYSYTSENQMTKAEYFEGTTKLKTVSFAYDVQGRRIKKSVQDLQNSKEYERKFAYDGSEIIAELDEDNNVLARYTHSGLRTDDVLSADITSDGVSAGLAVAQGSVLYLKDGLGSIQSVTNSSGNVLQRYVYSSFGKLLKIVDEAGSEITPVIKTAFTYTNREHDEETGLYYYRARFYDPARGQFLTEDPHPGILIKPLTFSSVYIYALNNSIRYTDPNGEFFGEITLLSTIIGAVVGGVVAGLNNKDIMSGVFMGAVTGATIGLGIETGGLLLGPGAALGESLLVSGFLSGFFTGTAMEIIEHDPNSFNKGFGEGFVGGVLGTAGGRIGLPTGTTEGGEVMGTSPEANPGPAQKTGIKPPKIWHN